MEPSPIVEREQPADDAAHGDTFYEQTNPKVFGLPLGVVIAAGISGVAVFITLLKFVAGSL